MRSPVRQRLLIGDGHAAAPAADDRRPAALTPAAIVLMFLGVAGGIVLLSSGSGSDYVAVRQHVSSSLQAWRRMVGLQKFPIACWRTDAFQVSWQLLAALQILSCGSDGDSADDHVDALKIRAGAAFDSMESPGWRH